MQSVPGRALTRAVRLHDGAQVEPLCGITLALKYLRLDSGMVCEGACGRARARAEPPSQGLIFGGPVVVYYPCTGKVVNEQVASRSWA